MQCVVVVVAAAAVVDLVVVVVVGAIVKINFITARINQAIKWRTFLYGSN